MVISQVGSANVSATTSVAIPTHQIGDIIIIAASGGSAPTIPGAAGTVPTFNSIQAGAANTRGLTTAWARATATNHTSGTWTNATGMVCVVLRGAKASGDVVGASNTTNGNNTQTVVYPSLTVSVTDGSSWGIRAGTRTTADTDLNTAPGSFTHIAGNAATPTLAMSRLADLTGNIAQESVSTPPTNSAYRAHTIEILAEPPPPFTASAALAVASSLLSGVASFSVPAHTASVALGASASLLSAATANTNPVYESTADLTVSSASLSAEAEFQAQVYEAEAGLVTSSVTLEVSAECWELIATTDPDALTYTDVNPGPGTHCYRVRAVNEVGVSDWSNEDCAVIETGDVEAIASLESSPVELSTSVEFDAPVYEIEGNLVSSSTELAASSGFDAPVYEAEAALETQPSELSVSTIHAAAVYSAAAELETSSGQLAASANFTSPTYEASANLVSGSSTIAANVTFSTHIALVSAVIFDMGNAIEFTFDRPYQSLGSQIKTAMVLTGSRGPLALVDPLFGSLDSLSFSGALSRVVYADETITLDYEVPPGTLTAQDGTSLQPFVGFSVTNNSTVAEITASAGLTISSASLSSSVAFTAPIYEAVVALTSSPVEMVATAIFSAALRVAESDLTTSSVTAEASAEFFIPLREASASLTVSHVSASATVAFQAPLFQAQAALSTNPTQLQATVTHLIPLSQAAVSLVLSSTIISSVVEFVAPVYTVTAGLTVSRPLVEVIVDTNIVAIPYVEFVDPVMDYLMSVNPVSDYLMPVGEYLE